MSSLLSLLQLRDLIPFIRQWNCKFSLNIFFFYSKNVEVDIVDNIVASYSSSLSYFQLFRECDKPAAGAHYIEQVRITVYTVQTPADDGIVFCCLVQFFCCGSLW